MQGIGRLSKQQKDTMALEAETSERPSKLSIELCNTQREIVKSESEFLERYGYKG